MDHLRSALPGAQGRRHQHQQIRIARAPTPRDAKRIGRSIRKHAIAWRCSSTQHTSSSPATQAIERMAQRMRSGRAREALRNLDTIAEGGKSMPPVP